MKDETILLNKFKLDRYSPLVEDALLINLDLKKYRDAKSTLLHATILGLFENKKELVIFFYLPEPGQYLSEVVINKHRYGVQIQDEEGFVHKYVITTPFKPGKLEVSEYVFVDDVLKRTTLHVQEDHIFGVLNDHYYYDSKKYYQTQLEGELLYDIIDMSTVQNKVEDFLGRPFLYKDISSLKAKATKLYYVAFNLFDSIQKQYLTPEHVVEMRVSYEEKRYVYQAKKVIDEKDIDPSVDGDVFLLNKNETIAKEPRKIETGEKSDWNLIQNFFTYKQYRYHSIYKINDQVKVKEKQTQNYTYVLVIGPKFGYRYSQAILKRKNGTDYDYEETTLSKIKIYHLTYQEKGHRYAVPVQSLVYETDKKARLPRVRHRMKMFFKTLAKVVVAPIKFLFGATGFIYQLIRWIFKHWKLLLILLVASLLVYLGVQIAGWFQ
ncbi:MAG: hypothetical protein FJ352_01015 [Firmicutes bacterium]|nr:hypothetical protein [Bacillota bacterium]